MTFKLRFEFKLWQVYVRAQVLFGGAASVLVQAPRPGQRRLAAEGTSGRVTGPTRSQTAAREGSRLERRL